MMKDTSFKDKSPNERLLISREQIRNTLRNAPPVRDSLLKTILESAATKHPLGLAATAAVLGGLLMATRPWRWKILKVPLMMWLPVVVNEWIQSRASKN